MNNIIIFLVLVAIVTLIRSVRIVVKKVNTKTNVSPVDFGVNYIRIVGDWSFIKENSPNKSDAEILNEATEKFRGVFTQGLELYGLDPNKVDSFFKINVYRPLNNTDSFISEAFCINDEATGILTLLKNSLS
jgi:hypothetical protein